MTSRGNQSVSPPAQIPQQRHVNAISSSTPPPQQFYTGPSPALSQGPYDFLPQAQNQTFNPYQAYGSALSDTRGQPGNSGRGVPPQQNLPQGGNFYQQPGPNIRPQQQTQQSHTYFISAQPQGNLRPPRPPHPSTSQMMFIPQNFTPRSNVITLPANVYQSARVPVFQPYVQGATYPTNIVYYQNGGPAWQGSGMAPTAASAIRPQVREKRVLSIMDPDTGRDITEELLNSRSHSTSTEEHHEEIPSANQNDKEICQTFTRLVADRLKSPDDSNTSGTSAESHGPVTGAPVSSSGTVSASQHYQQPPPQQQVQQQPPSIAPTTMMRPPPSVPHHIIPTRPGIIQQPPNSTTPSHDIPHQVLNVNLSMPPPQFTLRQATYSNAPQQQQHPVHQVPRHQQPPQQQQSTRPQMPPVIPPPHQQTHAQPHPQHQPPQPVHSVPSSPTIDSATQIHKGEPSAPDKHKPQMEATSQNIPIKPTGPPAPTQPSVNRPSSPVKEVSTVPQQTVEIVETKPAAVLTSVKTVANSEVNKVEDVKAEIPHGGSAQVKDGRKGKKGKKDFICKEIGGTDMDAFIDLMTSYGKLLNVPSQPDADIRGNRSWKKSTRKSLQLPFAYSSYSVVCAKQSTQKAKPNQWKSSAARDNVNPVLGLRDSEPKKSEQTTTKNVMKRDPKNPWKIQSAPEAPAKKDAQNPLSTLKAPEPVQAKLPVSTSSVKQSSGDKEHSNPWKVLPVATVESSVTNPLKDSHIKKSVTSVVSNPLQNVKKNTVVSKISDPSLDSNGIPTLSPAENLVNVTSQLTAQTSSKSVKTTLSNSKDSPVCEIVVAQTLTTNLKCSTSESAQNIKHNGNIASRQTTSSQAGNKAISKINAIPGASVVNTQVKPSLSQNLEEKTSWSNLFQNTQNKNLPFSTSPCLGKNEKLATSTAVTNLKNSITSAGRGKSKCSKKTASSVPSSSQNCVSSNTSADSDVLKTVASSLELCVVKPDATPACATVTSMKTLNSSASDIESKSSIKKNTIIDSSINITSSTSVVDMELAEQVPNKGINPQFVQCDKTTSNGNMNVSTLKNAARRDASLKSETTLIKPYDQSVHQVDGANSGAGESNITKTNNALDVTTEAGSNGIAPQSSIGHSSTKNIETSVVSKDSESSNVNVPKVSQTPEVSGAHFDTGYSRDDSPIPQKSYQEQQRPAIASAQVESKHKQKKKKKKGRKTPPNQKIKPCTSSNDNSEAQSEVVEVDEKPPLPQTTAVRKSSLDKSSIQEFKIPSTSIPATQETFKATKEPLSQPLVPPTITKPTHHIEIKMDKTVAAPQKEIKATVEAVPTTDTAVSITTTNITKHDNQQQIEQKGTSVRSNPRLSGQAERQISKPLENGIKDNLHSEPFSTATSNITSDSSETNLQVIGHDNQLPREPVSELEDLKVGQSHGTDNEESPTKLSSEKALNRVKRDKDKLQYDRAYLMELRQCASSQTKPEGLPNLEIILDRPVISAGRGSSTAPVDFTPAFFQPIGNQRHAPQIGKTNSRNRPRSDIQMPQRVIKSVSLQDSVKPLHQSEKPWKPSQKQVSSTGELSEKRRSLESEVLFIMNRLTPTNFERLAGEMKTLNIKSYEDLQELVKIFFDKVTMETKFVEAYANLCKVMSGLRVQPPPNTAIKDNQATFRVVMLTKCQQEFEADKTVVFEDPEEKKKKIESEMPEGPERTAQIENTLYQMKLKRLKFYGNIRFIGELFKLGMLTENIMHDCIYRLLKARDDDSLVSLCNLVATVGQVLDTDKAKTRMDQYYAQMAKIAEERKSRIKFTLKDAIDLRSNNWVPRKEQAGPKKIDEVHKDYQDEQATKQFLQSQPLPPRNDTPQPNSRRGSRQRQDDNKLTDEGWNTVGSKSLRIDASKMKLSKNVVDENIQLGPGGGMKQYSMWSKGSYGGSQLSQDNDRATPTNRFSALHGEEERLTYQRSPSRGDNSAANRGLRQGPTAGHGRGKILARSSQEGDRRDALASARSIVGGRSQNSSRDNSWNREDRRQIIGPRGSRESENPMTRSEILLRPSTDSLHVPTTVSPVPGVSAPTGLKVKQLSVDEMEKKAKTILEEYLSVMDLEEAKLCLHELSNQEHLHVFVTACINEVLERSLKARELTGSFFHEMIRQSNLAKDIYLKGLADVLQYAEDMVIDIPMIFTYLAQMIVPMLIGGSVAWSLLPTALKPLLGERSSGVLVAEILLLAKEKTSEDDVALMWQNNNLNWTTFLPAEEVDRFLKDKKLEFTVSQVTRVASRVPVYSPIDLQKVSEDIENIVLKNGTSIDVWSYIEARVPVDRQDKPFIRALVTALINASISTPAMKFSEEVIKSRKDVLRRCIKSNPELELQALYAVQAVMHKLEHPSGVVATIFDMLYDEDIVSEDTFKQWQKSTDPQEMEGKGTCSMQLTHFFTWLRENEEPETS